MVYNFQTCCDFKNKYFNINTTSTLVMGGVYAISLKTLSVCATVVDEIPLGYTTYFDDGSGDYLLIEGGCYDCLNNYYPCYPSVTPTPSPNLPINKNDCDPITIFPMSVECIKNNPTLCQNDGHVSVSITGGTPPYTITWTNPVGDYLGGSLELINLSSGTYISTIVDHYGDFTAVTTCDLISPRPVIENIYIIITQGDVINNITFNDNQLIINNNNYPLTANTPYLSSILSGHYTVSINVTHNPEYQSCIGVGGKNQTLLDGTHTYTFYNTCLNGNLTIALFVPDEGYYPCS